MCCKMDLNKFNKKQKQAILNKSNIISIIATAGSGKTKTLIAKIIWLIEENILNKNEKICVLTFSNKSMLEIKNRLKKFNFLLGKKIFIFTFHGLCNFILRKEIMVFSSSYKNNFTIVDDSDLKKIIRNYLKSKDLSKADILNLTREYFQGYKNNRKELFLKIWLFEKKTLEINITTKTKISFENNLLTKILNDFNCENSTYSFLSHFKRNNNLLDFEDLLFIVYFLLKINKKFLEKWEKFFSYFFIDEFQDTSPVQFLIIKQVISNNDKKLIVVGDFDQTIYSFRGIDSELFHNFQDFFTLKSTKIILDINYRSTKPICDFANNLIEKNSNRIKKNLISFNKNGVFPEIYFADNENKEIIFIIKKIKKLLCDKSLNIKLNDIAILFRVNWLSLELEKQLFYQKIPYVYYGSTSFFQKKEIKFILNFLNFFFLKSEFCLKNYLLDIRNIGEKKLKKWELIINKSGEELSDYLKKIIKNKELYELKEVFSAQKAAEKDNLVNEIYLKQTLKKTSFYIKIEKDSDRKQNLFFFMELIKNLNFVDTQNFLTQFMFEKEDLTENNHNKLEIMTIHKAKGLEKRVIFIYGVREGIIPHTYAKKIEEIEEERRILYVAVTRAREFLYLTTTKKNVSQFISELEEKNYKFI